MHEQEAVCTDEGLRRRSFLGGAIYALTSLIGGTLTAFGGRYLLGTPQEAQSAWTDAGEVPDLQIGSPREVAFERSRTDGWETHNERATAWVILNNDHSITAFSPSCTHLGCAYGWQANQEAFVCPCHGSKFAADGKVISGPANRPLDQYRVKMEGTRLWLELSKNFKAS
jgi:menaquinol-cytochrome c reductase iron-sulfur subunit